MADQLRVSPSENERRIIALLAKWRGTSEASIVMDGFRRAKREMLNEYEQEMRVLSTEPESNPLRSLLLRLAVGDFVADEELEEYAGSSGLSMEMLRQIRDSIK